MKEVVNEKSKETKKADVGKNSKTAEVAKVGRHETVHHEPAKVPEAKAEIPEVLGVKHCKHCGEEFTPGKYCKHFCSWICRAEH